MATLQKTLAAIRELQDEELDLIGGLAGTTVTTETWYWCHPDGAPAEVYVQDRLVITTGSD